MSLPTVRPDRTLIVLSTQRSGSTMVCDDISGTSRLGRPSEYFLPVIASWRSKSGEELKSKIRDVWARGATENGVVGVKVMSNQLTPIGMILQKAEDCDAEEPLNCAFRFLSGAAFIRVVRRDKVAQAVSRVMAQETAVFHIADSREGLEGMIGRIDQSRDESMVEYSRARIDGALQQILSEELALDRFTKRLSVAPIDVVYENAVADRSYVFTVAAMLGVDDLVLRERRLRKVGSEISEAWISRFRKGE